MRGGSFVGLLVGAAMILGACSTGSTSSSGRTTTTTTLSTPDSQATTNTTTSAASNLVVTNAIRSQLVAAGAALNSLPSSDYTGLRPGETYYAYDPASQTYWASAGLVPSPSSTQAQISVQDDGAYLLFDRPQGGTWKGYDVGLAGTPDGSPCPVTVPGTILNLWGWAPGSCRPAMIS